MSLTAILITGLASWRVARALVMEEGPARVFVRLREISGIIHDDRGEIVGWRNDWTPLHCVWCTSIWTAIVLSFLPEKVRDIAAAMAVAVFLQASYARVVVTLADGTSGHANPAPAGPLRKSMSNSPTPF